MAVIEAATHGNIEPLLDIHVRMRLSLPMS